MGRAVIVAVVLALAASTPASASSGAAATWGSNLARQLGDGSVSAFSDVPVPVVELVNVVSVAGGARHSLALLGNGKVMAWGSNEEGQLGTGGTPVTSNVPLAVASLSEVKAIAAGANHSLALLNNGTVMAWGEDAQGQLGNGATAVEVETPIAVSGLTGATAVAAGGQRSLALVAGGAVRTWGDDEWGSLGDGVPSGLSDVPVAVSGLSGVAGIAAGSLHSLAFGEPVPAVSSLSPGSGPNAGGTSVTITGVNLGGATTVKFGPNAATSFIVNSASSITAVAPPGSGIVDVTVTTPFATSPLQASDRYTYLPPPAVKKLTPKLGTSEGGTKVTITGTNFTGATAVKFGTTDATSFVVNSSTSITAIAPAHALGKVDVTVTSPVGTSAITAADHYTYEPTVEGLSPNTGPVAGGTTVTITGTGFALGSTATIVKFATKRATSVNCTSSTLCTAVAPAHEAGTVAVKVTVAKVSSPANPGDLYTYS